VGECYRDFGQVADEEVVEILRRAGALHSTASS
jgi:predicted phosphoribosyltransferase